MKGSSREEKMYKVLNDTMSSTLLKIRYRYKTINIRKTGCVECMSPQRKNKLVQKKYIFF